MQSDPPPPKKKKACKVLKPGWKVLIWYLFCSLLASGLLEELNCLKGGHMVKGLVSVVQERNIKRDFY